jgi:hypothetical protein
VEVARAAGQLSASLTTATSQAAVAFAAGDAVSDTISAGALVLAKGGLQAMAWSKTKIGLAALLLAVIGTSGYLALRGMAIGLTAAAPQDARTPEGIAPAPKSKSVEPATSPAAGKAPDNIVQIPSSVDGQILFVARELRMGEKVPDRDKVTRKVGGDERVYRRLRPGDRIDAERMFAQIDDREVRAVLALREAKRTGAKAEERAAKAAANEGEARYRRALMLRGTGAISEQELGEAMLTKIKLEEEFVARQAAVAVAEIDVFQAQLQVDLYQVRSPVRGVIDSFVRRPGEAVRKFEPILRLRVIEEP